MKKLIVMLLALVMVLNLAACGGAAAPAATEPAVQMTEAPAEAPTGEPTEAPTEAPRVAPTDFEAVDPATLPEPIPVEEQLQSEDTRTVILGSLEEYEDFLWDMGFKEVRLAGMHRTSFGTDAYCEPVSLTYNSRAFCFEFTYYIGLLQGEIRQEPGWKMYGTKSRILENVSPINGDAYIKAQGFSMNTVVLDGDQSVDNIDPSAIITGPDVQKNETVIKTPNYEMEVMSFSSLEDMTLTIQLKAVYYPVTGNLYNYVPDINGEGITGTELAPGDYSPAGTIKGIGALVTNLCLHYLFPGEDTAQ